MAGITLHCRNEHAFVTQAKPGNTVACPACRREGRGRISCRVPMRAAELADQLAPAEESSARLAAAWAAEVAPVSGQLGADAGQACEQCGGPMYWTAAHTAVMCPACPAWSVSAGLRSRAAEHGQALELRAARSRGEIAIRSDADETEERRARIALRSHREAVLVLIEQLEAIADQLAYDRAQDQQAAFEIGATLRGYKPEIQAAADETTLAEISREVVAIRDSDQLRELAAEAERVELRREQRRAAIAQAQRQAEAAAAWQIEAQRQAVADQRQAEAAERQRRAAAPQRTSAELAVRKPSGAVVTAGLVALAEARSKAIQDKGACGFKHAWAAIGVPAERLYGVQIQAPDGRTWLSDQHPSIRACRKHFGAADRWITDHDCPDAVYWEL